MALVASLVLLSTSSASPADLPDVSGVWKPMGSDDRLITIRALSGKITIEARELSCTLTDLKLVANDMAQRPAALTAKGIQVLKDARTRLEIHGEGLELAGIRFWTRKTSDIARVIGRARDTVLLLAHDPRRLDEAADLDVPAVLAGHTHGGQVVLPGVGAVARRRFPVLSGLGSRDNTWMFVSRGIGTVYVPIRVNCPPEVAIVTLKRRSEI